MVHKIFNMKYMSNYVNKMYLTTGIIVYKNLLCYELPKYPKIIQSVTFY